MSHPRGPEPPPGPLNTPALDLPPGHHHPREVRALRAARPGGRGGWMARPEPRSDRRPRRPPSPPLAAPPAQARAAAPARHLGARRLDVGPQAGAALAVSDVDPGGPQAPWTASDDVSRPLTADDHWRRPRALGRAPGLWADEAPSQPRRQSRVRVPSVTVFTAHRKRRSRPAPLPPPFGYAGSGPSAPTMAGAPRVLSSSWGPGLHLDLGRPRAPLPCRSMGHGGRRE